MRALKEIVLLCTTVLLQYFCCLCTVEHPSPLPTLGGDNFFDLLLGIA